MQQKLVRQQQLRQLQQQRDIYNNELNTTATSEVTSIAATRTSEATATTITNEATAIIHTNGSLHHQHNNKAILGKTNIK